jgi:hypothetical protein
LKSFRKKFPKPPEPAETAAAAHQRRLAKIVHDDRGSASVEWHEAPDNYNRPVLAVDDPLAVTRNSKVRGGIEVLHINKDNTFNPYERQIGAPKAQNGGTRSDLRKLSEYIKMMREREERNKNGGGEES